MGKKVSRGFQKWQHKTAAVIIQGKFDTGNHWELVS